MENNVIDLGNYLVAYAVSGKNTHWAKEENNYIVIQNLITGDNIYIPNDFGKIFDINVTDDSGIKIIYSNRNTIEEISIPIHFADIDDNMWEVDAESEKIILNVRAEYNLLPEVIWSETIENEEKYDMTFERTSLLYSNVYPEISGERADYRLTVRDKNGNMIWEQKIINYPVLYEEVHWIKDISGDGYPDIILCTDYISQPSANTRLNFWVWNAKNRIYEMKSLPDAYVMMPIWNESLSTLMYFQEGFNPYVIDMKMFTLAEEEWELYAEIRTCSEQETMPVFENEYQREVYYKELDYIQKEIFYENGEAVAESDTEGGPWWDENSIWYRDSKENEHFYPEGKWKREDVTLNTGEVISKYVQVN
ncbi:MAG: hypothetical protein K2N15_05385 [Lachnospiraceae bacterium]|nr:hypothetical protein [Lachnospiraceae bacterium]